jgi:hypothetical protein
VAEHGLLLELFYNGVWNPAPLLQRDLVQYQRGSKEFGNDTEPATGSGTIDNISGAYAPRSLLSGLYGKIGQNTPARLTADGSVRANLEMSRWEPTRPIKGSGWTKFTMAGILRRVGIGTDPIRSALVRAADATRADGLVAFWPLDEGKYAVAGANLVQGGDSLTPGRPDLVVFGGFDGAIPAGLEAMPAIGATYLGGRISATSVASWRVELAVAVDGTGLTGASVVAARWQTGGGIQNWWLEYGDDGLGNRSSVLWGVSPFIVGTPFGITVQHTSGGDPDPLDARVHQIVLDVAQTDSTHMAYSVYYDGVLIASGSNTTGAIIGRPQVGAPSLMVVNPDSSARVLTAGGVGVWSPHPAAPIPYAAVGGYAGETSAARFQRFCDQEAITATIVGTGSNTVLMGPQGTEPLLQQFDLIAATDDASIYETRGAAGLTMRTGASKLNQSTALNLSYLGQVKPPLTPVYGDVGIRNDVTARNPDGTTGRVTQDTGPRNTKSPLSDPQGVGRYNTSIDVNVPTVLTLADEAGWRLNQGTFDGTWYASVTVDLDMAKGITAAVNAVDVGDVVRLRDLPAEDTVSDFYALVIAIGELYPPKSREVTFYLIPADPYRVGVLSGTAGDTAALVGHVEADSGVLASAAGAGASTFSVTASPLWTTVADDFPQDVMVGSQRVTVSGVAGAGAPQTFTVSTAAGAYPLRYGVPTGAPVSEYQPIITTLVD